MSYRCDFHFAYVLIKFIWKSNNFVFVWMNAHNVWLKLRIISFEWCAFLMVQKVGISLSCGWSVRQTNQQNAIKIGWEPRKISYENAFHMNENHRNTTNSLILALAMKCNFKISVLFDRGIPRNTNSDFHYTLLYFDLCNEIIFLTLFAHPVSCKFPLFAFTIYI